MSQNKFNSRNKSIKSNQKSEPALKKSSANSFPAWLRLENLLTVFYLIALLITFVKTYDYVYDSKLHLGGDNAGYYILGKAIAEGEGYTNIHFAGNPPANHFPPGYPVIVAGVMKIFNSDFQTIKTANGVFFFLSIVILFFLFKKISSNLHLSFVVCALLLINFHLLQYSFIMMSEVPFLLFSCITIYLFTKIDHSKNPLRSSYFYLFLLALVSSYYLRTMGIALLGGVLFSMLLIRSWKYFGATILGFILLIVPWTIRGSMLGGNSHLKQLLMVNPYRPEEGMMGFGDWFLRFYINLKRYVSQEIPASVTGENLFDYKQEVMLNDYLFGGVLIILMVYGIWKLARLRFLITGYLSGTFFILLLWPDVWNGTRFMLPVIPFVVFLPVYGCYTLVSFLLEKTSFKNQKLKAAALPFAFLAMIPMYRESLDYLHTQKKGMHHLKYTNYNNIGEWAKKNTPPDAVISCRKPEIFYLYSHRQTTGYLNTKDPFELVENLKANNVNYVVFDQLGFSSTSRYLFPAIRKFPFQFEIVHTIGVDKSEENPITYLIKFHPENVYEGEMNDSLYRHGYGKVRFYDGSIYEGNWEMDQINGFGKMTYSAKSYYEGEWVNGIRKGKGNFYWPNGLWFEGEWNNVRNGKGRLYVNGNILVGTWENDLSHGPALVYNSNGRLIEKHLYDKGKLVKNEIVK